MTPELRDTTRRVHLLVGKRRPHEVVQLNKNDLVALLAASGRTHARIEAGEVLAHLNDIWAADIERDCGRVVTAVERAVAVERATVISHCRAERCQEQTERVAVRQALLVWWIRRSELRIDPEPPTSLDVCPHGAPIAGREPQSSAPRAISAEFD
jgi:hypothetical protein